MYIDEVPNRNSPPAVLLRESYREGNKVLKRTLANLTKWPSSVVEGLRLLLRGGTAIKGFEESFEIVRSLPHGQVAAVLGTLSKLKLEKLIAPERSVSRDRVLAMIVARVLAPRSKLATARGFGEETASSSLGELLEVEAAEAEDTQLSLFDERDLVEITRLEYPGERLIVCRNPALVEDRARTREAALAGDQARARQDRDGDESAQTPLAGPRPHWPTLRAKVVNRFKMAKHFEITITEEGFVYQRNEARIAGEAALDGLYVIRTSVPKETLETEEWVARLQRPLCRRAGVS